MTSEQLKLFPDDSSEPVWLRHQHSEVLLQKISGVGQCHIPILSFIKSCQGMTKKIANASAVFIKPNITSGELPEAGRTTHPDVLKALLDSLRSLGIPLSQVVVGDSSVINVNTIEAAKTAGIWDVCEHYGVAFSDLNEGPFMNKNVDRPL